MAKGVMVTGMNARNRKARHAVVTRRCNCGARGAFRAVDDGCRGNRGSIGGARTTARHANVAAQPNSGVQPVCARQYVGLMTTHP
jgi:hypothetical protein